MENELKTQMEPQTQVKIVALHVVAILIAFAVSLATTIFFVRRIFVFGKTRFDEEVFTYLQNSVSDNLTQFMKIFTIFGSQYFLIPGYLLLMFYYFGIKRSRWMGSKVIAVSVSSLLLMFSLKYLFMRPRPLTPLLHEVSGYSFPSGHAFMSFSFFGLLIYILNKHAKPSVIKFLLTVLLGLFICLIGISRVYLRVHYASDVIAGFCMGFMWLVVSLFAMSFIQKRYEAGT